MENDEAPYLDLDESTKQPQLEYQTISKNNISNSDDGTYLQPMILNSPLDDHGEYQYVRDPQTIMVNESKLSTGSEFQLSAHRPPSINSEPLQVDLDPSIEQPKTDEHHDCNITNTDDGTYLEPLTPNSPPKDRDKYQYIIKTEINQRKQQKTENGDYNINDDDGTYLEPKISNDPKDDRDKYQTIRKPEMNSADESKPPKRTVLQSSATIQQKTEDDVCDINNTDDGTYLEPNILNSLPDDNDEYQYISDPETTLADEKPYMDLDASSRHPNSVYQELTKPEHLKQRDTYLALNPKSRSTETEYQSIDPREQDS